MMGKALSGELSCPCDRSCFYMFENSKQSHVSNVCHNRRWHIYIIKTAIVWKMMAKKIILLNVLPDINFKNRAFVFNSDGFSKSLYIETFIMYFS